MTGVQTCALPISTTITDSYISRKHTKTDVTVEPGMDAGVIGAAAQM